ncbi:MAG TPA: ABC transporter substrate binding protein [Burkholderiaceae bacterium]|nr:ABC transporter substrate binding protein [Burkholderiaceae bacterium]
MRSRTWALRGVALGALWAAAATAQAAPYKVLVVMSYEEDNPWVREIREGIESALGPHAQISYVYMDTKRDRAGGPAKAAAAYEQFQQLQPDGVIAADDDAQSMFVVPYLKDRADVPVVFNGVNADAAKYGYPTAQITGVLERAHVHESLAFVRQLLPTAQTACFLTANVPAGAALKAQVDAEKAGYPMKVGAFHMVGRLTELQALGRGMNASCDALFVDSLEGIAGPDDKALDNREALAQIGRIYQGPILGGNRYQVEQGAWAAVVKTGQEQGELSANLLLQALQGTPVSRLPIVKNVRGQRVINVTAVEAHKLALRPQIIKGATLVRQQP